VETAWLIVAWEVALEVGWYKECEIGIPDVKNRAVSWIAYDVTDKPYRALLWARRDGHVVAEFISDNEDPVRFLLGRELWDRIFTQVIDHLGEEPYNGEPSIFDFVKICLCLARYIRPLHRDGDIRIKRGIPTSCPCKTWNAAGRLW
jgi:hypothetical protein